MTREQELLRKYLECQDHASRQRTLTTIRARPLAQAGSTALVGTCPCGTTAALSGEGRHLCRKCGRWLRYVRER
jgi:hypothetical protein